MGLDMYLYQKDTHDVAYWRKANAIHGWIIEETDPELAKQAKWLADERKREYDAWVASIERNYTEENSSVYSAD